MNFTEISLLNNAKEKSCTHNFHCEFTFTPPCSQFMFTTKGLLLSVKEGLAGDQLMDVL